MGWINKYPETVSLRRSSIISPIPRIQWPSIASINEQEEDERFINYGTQGLSAKLTRIDEWNGREK